MGVCRASGEATPPIPSETTSRNWTSTPGSKNNSENKTQPVGQKRAYAFGLLDIYGNVDEWVEDTIFHPSYEGAPTDGSAWVINGDKWRRMVRGGSWNDFPESLRSASRNAGTGDGRTYDHVRLSSR